MRRTHRRLPHHIPLAEQIHSWSAGKGPTAYKLPCIQDCQTTHKQYIFNLGAQIEPCTDIIFL